MKRFSEAKKIFLVFLIWRITLFIIAYLAGVVIPKWGGRFPYADRELIITGLPPWVWGFGNFDGVHYLRIAQNGYNFLASQAFFPLYPLVIKLFSLIIPKNPLLDIQVFVDPAFFYSGLLISNIFFVLGLYFFYKLVKNDFNEKVAFWSVLFLLAFPTSFYFGSIYTESIFLFFASSCFYFLRKEKYGLASVLAALASATRLVGVVLLLPIAIAAFKKTTGFQPEDELNADMSSSLKKTPRFQRGEDVIEIFKRCKESKFKDQKLIKIFITVLIAPLGTVVYMLFLQIRFSDVLSFLKVQPIFGAERSGGSIIFLPQVLFRYARILLGVNSLSSENVIVILELVFTLIALGVLIFSFKKIRISYWLFSLIALLLPTFTGTLSSMPRYLLSGFLLIPFIVTSLNKRYLYLIIVIFMLLHVILLSMFIRGYWVA